MSGEITKSQLKVLRALCANEPCSCTEVGELIWTGGPGRLRQSWARPAGRALHALRRLGLAVQRRTRKYGSGGRVVRIHEWWATGEGKEKSKP